MDALVEIIVGVMLMTLGVGMFIIGLALVWDQRTPRNPRPPASTSSEAP